MTSIAHLLDDTSLGGVTRMLADNIAELAKSRVIDRIVVNPRRPRPPLVTHDVAVLHFTASWTKLPFMALLRAQRADRPIVLVEHTYTRAFEEQCVPNARRFRRMLRLAYRLVDSVVAVSEEQAEWLREIGVVAVEKLVVIPPSVDCSRLLQVPELEPRGNRPIRLLAYGRYCHQKGFDVAIEAMRHLDPSVANLTLAGFGPDQEALERSAKDIASIQLVGAVADLPALIGGCDAVLVPSRWEAFGLVALEARAAGRPILVSKVDGLRGQADASGGIQVVPDQPTSLASAIEMLATYPIEYMGRCARVSVREHHANHIALWEAFIEASSSRSATVSGAPLPHLGQARVVA